VHLLETPSHQSLQKVDVGLLDYFLREQTEGFIINLHIKKCYICQLNNRLMKIVLYRILYPLQKGVGAISSIGYESDRHSIRTPKTSH